jgi:hypothetical protein
MAASMSGGSMLMWVGQGGFLRGPVGSRRGGVGAGAVVGASAAGEWWGLWLLG